MMGSRLICVAALLLAALTSTAQNLQSAPNSGPATFGGGTYTYDPAGNIIAIDNQYFLYDTTGRLTQASVMAPDRSTVTQSYTYDVYGNLLTMARTGVTQTMTVDITNNHLMNGSVDYDYDVAGNLQTWTPPGTSTTYQYGWDGLGNLQSIRLASQPVNDPPAVAYLYTASDERISTFDVPNQASHWMIRDLGGQVLTDFLDSQGTWSWTRDYFYRDGTMLAATLPNIVQHYTVDHLGSPRLLTDDSANQIAAQTFLPFGEELQATFSNGAAIKKFTSHERDNDPGLTGTSLDYMHARYFNGLTGKFLSVDPVLGQSTVPQSWNRYSYVLNNPVGRTDPDGRCVWDLCIGETALVIAATATVATAIGIYVARNPPAAISAQSLGNSIKKSLVVAHAVTTVAAAMMPHVSLSKRPNLVTPTGVVLPGGKNVDLVPTAQGAANGTPWVQIHDDHDHNGQPHTHTPEVHEGPNGEIDVKRLDAPTTAADIDDADKKVKEGDLRPRRNRRDKGDPSPPQE